MKMPKFLLSALFLTTTAAFAKESTPSPLLSCPAGLSVRWVCVDTKTKQPSAGGSCSGLCVIGTGGVLSPEKMCDWVRTTNGDNWEQPDGAILAKPRDPTKPVVLECMNSKKK